MVSGYELASRSSARPSPSASPYVLGDGYRRGRMPETAWYPSNNVLVGVAQVREIEFIANNPGDWILHCHMFHHLMNSMTSQAGPLIRNN
jgi:FtsP/CotA-like multicopper oxidase with cupredoxin domain